MGVLPGLVVRPVPKRLADVSYIATAFPSLDPDRLASHHDRIVVASLDIVMDPQLCTPSLAIGMRRQREGGALTVDISIFLPLHDVRPQEGGHLCGVLYSGLDARIGGR